MVTPDSCVCWHKAHKVVIFNIVITVNINQVQRILLTNFLLMLGIALLMVALYETEILTPSDMASSQTMVFGILVVMELLTIVVIPLALKLFSFKFIRRRLLAKKGDALLSWGTARLNMLCLPMIVNTFMYYQTMSPAFGYMGIILLLCLFFVYPSKERCYEETND